LVANIRAGSCWVLIHSASCEAAIGFFVDFSTASVDPPQLPEAGFWVSHCGRGATLHSPDVLAAVPCRNDGPHAAPCHEAYRPLARPWYHGSVKSGTTPMMLSRTRGFQKSITLATSGVSILIVTVFFPSYPKGRTPACHSKPMNWPASLPGMFVRYLPGFAAR